jgi:hypothetical protein
LGTFRAVDVDVDVDVDKPWTITESAGNPL